MTAKRAIEWLRIIRLSVDGRGYAEIALETAIKALEQQIPKKPEKVEDHLYCPNCDGFIGYVVDCEEEHYQIPYCSGCGQAIDWSENDD